MFSMSLHRDNSPSFIEKFTQHMSSALGSNHYLHAAWRPPPSGKVMRANQSLKNKQTTTTKTKTKTKTKKKTLGQTLLGNCRILNKTYAYSPVEN